MRIQKILLGACLASTAGLVIAGAPALAAGAGPVITGVSNNASGAAAIESGSWVSIYGSGLSAVTGLLADVHFNGNNLPTTLDNVSVQIDGKPAAIYYVGPDN